MTLLELETIAARADQLRALAEESRRAAGAQAAAGHRVQAASLRLEAMLADLQATALASTSGGAPRPVRSPVRAGPSLRRRGADL